MRWILFVVCLLATQSLSAQFYLRNESGVPIQVRIWAMGELKYAHTMNLNDRVILNFESDVIIQFSYLKPYVIPPVQERIDYKIKIIGPNWFQFKISREKIEQNSGVYFVPPRILQA